MATSSSWTDLGASLVGGRQRMAQAVATQRMEGLTHALASVSPMSGARHHPQGTNARGDSPTFKVKY